MHFHPYPSPNESTSSHSLVADRQQGLAIHPSVWPALCASLPYPEANEETGPQGTDLLG